jgi:hypothetical protein
LRLIDYFLRIATTALFVGYFVLPTRTWGLLGFGMIFAVGLWSLLYPQGMLGWAKAAHSELDPTDESLWWVPRLIGVSFVLLAILAIVMFGPPD